MSFFIHFCRLLNYIFTFSCNTNIIGMQKLSRLICFCIIPRRRKLSGNFLS